MNDKKLQKFLNNPTSLRYTQIETLLIQLDFQKISTRGSHIKFKHHLLKSDLIIPIHNNDCKDFYKKLVVKIIKQNKL